MLIMALLVTLVLERMLFTRWIWELKLYVIVPLSFLIPAITTSLVFQYPHWFGITIALLSIGRVFNLLRVAKGRMHAEYLYQSTKRTSFAFSALQLVLIPLAIGAVSLPFTVTHLPQITAFIQLFVAAGVLFITIRNVYKTRYKQGEKFYSDRELPTVSLVIPARNETKDLEECLSSALARNYRT